MALVLVVDDEASLVELLVAILHEMGHQVLSARNGQEALALLEQQVPALVISDLMMPLMDGYSLLENIRLRPEWSTIKVVLVSAVKMNPESKYRADEYVAKPFDLGRLEAVIQRLAG